MSVITFRINSEIKTQFQQPVFKFKYGQMASLLREAIAQLVDGGLPIARKYVNELKFIKRFSNLTLNDAQQITYSLNLDASLKSQFEAQLMSDNDIKNTVKSLSNYCRCVCEYYVYHLQNNQLMAEPKLMSNPHYDNHIVTYTLLIRHHFDNKTVDVSIPGLPENDFEKLAISVDNESKQVIQMCVNQLITRLNTYLHTLPKNTKPTQYQLHGVRLDDACETIQIPFDLNHLPPINDHDTHTKMMVALDESNAQFLKSMPDYNKLINQLITHFRSQQ